MLLLLLAARDAGKLMLPVEMMLMGMLVMWMLMVITNVM